MQVAGLLAVEGLESPVAGVVGTHVGDAIQPPIQRLDRQQPRGVDVGPRQHDLREVAADLRIDTVGRQQRPRVVLAAVEVKEAIGALGDPDHHPWPGIHGDPLGLGEEQVHGVVVGKRRAEEVAIPAQPLNRRTAHEHVLHVEVIERPEIRRGARQLSGLSAG